MTNHSSFSSEAFGDFKTELEVLRLNVDHMFLILMGCLIFFMQTGFAFLEAGSVRSKNTTNILIKNVLDVFIGGIAYWLFGYAFAFGPDSNAFIGHNYFALSELPSALYAHWFFHFVFAATAATIVSGAMAERTEFGAYFVYSIFITGLVYPIVTHWSWDENGWLAKGIEYQQNNQTLQVTYQDFAGSGVVHAVGGTCALVGAAILGPRIGRFTDGKPVMMQGHTVPKCALGGFILFFGFLAFNGGSQGSISNPGDAAVVSLAIVNTILGGAGGAITALIIKRMGFADRNWSLLVTINGGLTGMVALCCGCNTIHPYAAFLVGTVAGMTYISWSVLVLKLRVDDPLDAVAVHLGGGLWGVISGPIFNFETGIIYVGDLHSFRLFGWNLLGVLAIMCWSAAATIILFGSMRMAGLLRVSKELEIKGLDIPKHGEPAYPFASYGDGWTVNQSPSMYLDPRVKLDSTMNSTAEIIANGHTEVASPTDTAL